MPARIDCWSARGAPTRPAPFEGWPGSCPECPEFEKTTRDAFAPMFTGLSRLSRVSRVKNSRAGANWSHRTSARNASIAKDYSLF